MSVDILTILFRARPVQFISRVTQPARVARLHFRTRLTRCLTLLLPKKELCAGDGSLFSQSLKSVHFFFLELRVCLSMNEQLENS